MFADTVNGLGASAVPMPWGEVIPAAQQGVIDGADLPVVNINALKAYEVAKYASMTYHNYGPTVLVMNLDLFRGLSPEQQKLMLDVGREAQTKVRELTESVDNFQKAKEILGAQGHEGEPGRRGLVPQGCRGEDLAPVPAAVRRHVGQDRQYSLRRRRTPRGEIQWP